MQIADEFVRVRLDTAPVVTPSRGIPVIQLETNRIVKIAWEIYLVRAPASTAFEANCLTLDLVAYESMCT